MWKREDFPTCSLPALEAAKCAAFQSDTAFERMHLRLFEAFFVRGKNIGNPDEILEVAEEVAQDVPLDMEMFQKDFESGRARPFVFEDYREALGAGVHAIPTVIFQRPQPGQSEAAPPLFVEVQRVVGAVPQVEYVRVLRQLGVSTL